MAAQTYLAGIYAPLLTTELNALANNALVAGAAFTAANYLLAEVELYVPSLSGAATANTGLALWLLRSVDGNPAHYEDGSTAVTPARAGDQVFPLRPVATAQRVTRRFVVPPGTWIPLVKNDGSGVALAATGNTLSILPSTYQ